jgi:RND family efflux transporter MFP subunit
MNRAWSLFLLVATLSVGCSKPDESAAPPVELEPTVKVVHPVRRTIAHVVGQPGTIEAYERTGIYGKVQGYVEKWNVDVGDRVKQGQLLAQLSAPDLDAQLAKAKADLKQAQATLGVSEANNVLAKTTLARFRYIQKENAGAIAPLQIDEEVARVAATSASIEAARAAILVNDAAVARYAALQNYLKIIAPYDGVILARNINRGDFVMPATGDPSQGVTSLGDSPNKATPLYLMIRTDPVLFIVGVPEQDAPYVSKGAKARIRVPALAGHEFLAQVTRVSRALNSTSRTLMAEIELGNANGQFLPGMYAYGSVLIERPDAWAVPLSAIVQLGNKNYCFLLKQGKAVQTQVLAGITDGSWIEIIEKVSQTSWTKEGPRVPFSGADEIVVGNLSEIKDGEEVKVEPENSSSPASSS